MLSIGLVSAGQEQYYVDLSREDYYTDSGEPEGRWFGRGAEQLGLSESVEKETLSKLIRGYAPSGEKLVRNAGSSSRRAGLDLTFSAPKSVSVLWSQAREQETRRAIEEAHAAAVAAALTYIESEATFVRFGLDGVNRMQAGLVVATFEHSSARLASPDQRAPDPHLHTHALVINAGVAENGFTATLDSREFYRHKMTAGVLYRAELFRQLEQQFGILAERRGRFCELQGVPSELLEEFSKRRRAIEAYLAERGSSGGAQADEATLETRTVKPKVDRKRFFAEWQRIGGAFGFAVDATLRSRSEPREARDLDALLRSATEQALKKVTEQSSHFARRELIRALADQLEDQGVGADVVLRTADRALESPDVRAVGEAASEERFTTEEMLQLERAMLREAAGLSRREVGIKSATLVEVLRSRRSISEEQLEALHHMTERSALSLVRGLAGTGKTYLLDAAREAWEREGQKVLGATLAATAAKRLQEGSGIQSETLHRMLWRLENGKLALGENTVVVVDEAAMVGTRQLGALIRLVSKARAKLVLVGDDRQLQAIDAGAPFSSLAKRFGAAELQAIRRQRREWARDAVLEFSRGEARTALRRFEERGLIRMTETRSEAIQALVDDFERALRESSLQDTVALAGTRSEARKLNREVQLRRKARGELGEERLAFGEESFHEGDRILFRKNSKRLQVLNGDRGTVVGLTASSMTVRLYSGDRVSIDVRDHDLVKPHLGYAATTHSMQGATVERCFVLCGGSMQDREATYVQASRAREETRLYVDRVSAGEEFSGLVRSMERSRAKELAVDLEDALVGAAEGGAHPGGGGQELCVA